MSSIWLKLVILLWWLCNASYRIKTRHLDQDGPRAVNWAIFCKYLRFLEMTMLQCLAGAATACLILKLTNRKMLALPALNRKILALVVFCHIMGSVAINAAISMHSVYFQHLLRSFEPLLVFFILWTRRDGSLYLGNKTYVLCGIILTNAGLYLVLSHRPPKVFNARWGIVAAFVPMFMFPTRNVYLKAFGDTWEDPVQKYFVLSICGVLVLLPIVLAKLAYTRILPLLSPEMALWPTTFGVVDNLISFFLLELFSPQFHSVLCTLDRYSSAAALTAYAFRIFARPWQTLLGIILSFLGFVLYYLKGSYAAHELRKFLIVCVVALHFMFGGVTFLNTTRISKEQKVYTSAPTLIRSFWAYDKPPSKDVFLNMQRVSLQGRSLIKWHIHCGSLSCVKKIREMKNPRFSSSFLTFDGTTQSSPLDSWFKDHSLHKMLSGNEYEDHFHEATRLALIWNYGRAFVDPLLRIHPASFQELQNRNPWVATIENNNSSGTFLACRLKRHHPLVEELAKIFVTLYHRLCYLKASCEKLVLKFRAQSQKAFAEFCIRRSTDCPKVVRIAAERMERGGGKYTKHFGVKFKKYNTKVHSVGIENLATIQFFPFVEMSTSGHDARFMLKIGKPHHLIGLSEKLSAKKAYSLEYIASLREHAPIGCLDENTVNFLRAHNVEAFVSGGINILMKSPSRVGIERTNIYFVNLHQDFMAQLPSEIRSRGLLLKLGSKKNELGSRSLYKSVYVFLKKIAAARLVITGDIHWASVAGAFDTPVIFVKNRVVPEAVPDNSRALVQVFHTCNAKTHYCYSAAKSSAKNVSSNSTAVLISRLLSGELPAVANLGLFMRLRATTWNAIRRYDTVRESGLKFSVVPFNRPRSNTEQPTVVFHLIFTTSERSLISLQDKNSVKGGFVWRHWRCIESIFHHHPLATVVIHSNTLSSEAFGVLKESGYDIRVRRYSLRYLAGGTPAEVFVRDELPYAEEGTHWYSHETDLLRLLVLYKFGGIYMDIDVIVVRDLDHLPQNVIGWESSHNMNGAFLKFRKHHPYLHACIERFSSSYAQAWSDNGPLLLSRVWRKWSAANPNNDVATVGRKAFYMFFYRSIEKQCFRETSGKDFDNNWSTLRRQAYVVHLYSKVTAGHKEEKIKEGTLCKHILNRFCVLCNKVY